MKKYFPIIVFILGITGLLGGQFVFDFLSAGPTTKEKSINAHYQSAFSKLKVESVDQKKYDFSKVKAPIVILNFWASWCIPCLQEFPSIVELKNKFIDQEILIVGINSDEEMPFLKIKKVQKKYNLNFPIVSDSEGEILSKFLVSSLPMSIIFLNGKVYQVSKGAIDFNSNSLITKFKEILKNSKKGKQKVVKEKSSSVSQKPLRFKS